MSRTHRRRKDKTPSWVTDDYVRAEGLWYWVKVPMSPRKAKKEIAKWRSDAGWHDDGYGGCPGWFNKIYHIIPARRKAKHLQKEVLKLIDYEDSPEFPLWPDGDEYYW